MAAHVPQCPRVGRLGESCTNAMTSITRLLIIVIAAVFAALPPAMASDAAPTVKEITVQGTAGKLEDAERSLLKKGPQDEFGRGTPRSSVIGLARALIAQDFTRAVEFMDLRNMPLTVNEQDGPELARKLLIVARRTMVVDYGSLSDEPRGHADDGLPSYRDRVTTLKTAAGPVDILMQRVPRGDGEYVWKLSNATVAEIPALYAEFGYGPLGERLSILFPEYEVLGMEAWQWVMILILALCGYLFAVAITWLLNLIIPARDPERRKKIHVFMKGPLRFLILVLFVRATFHMIAPSLKVQALFQARTLLIVAMVWILMGLADLLLNMLAERMRRQGRAEAVVLLRPAASVVKIIVIAIGLVSWLDNLGYQVTTLIAGLGVGGVAVALAAQRTIENLIGSITIYSSQPVHVGDLCRFGETLGTVEEIGLRATQLRTLERTVVHVPNARFSTDIIENLTQRDRILYRCRLRLSFETNPQQVRCVLQEIRALIETAEYIDTGSSRVQFLELGQYAQELELFIYIMTTDFVEYLNRREDVNLRIIDIVADCGAQLTLPASLTRLEGAAGDLLSSGK